MYLAVLLLQVSIALSGSYEQMWRQGRTELKEGHYKEAVRTLIAAVQIGEEAGVEATLLATGVNDLAEVYRRLGQYADAESLYKRAVKLLQEQPDSARELVRVLNNKGTMYREMGLDTRSTAAYEEALQIARKAKIQDDLLVSAVLNGMAATISSAQGDLKRARRYLEESLSMRQKTLGPDHLDISETLNNLGVVYYHNRDYGKAESAFERALAITEKHLGSDHPDVAVTLNNQGVLYESMKRFELAERLLRRALDIRVRHLPPDHSTIADNLFNLSQVLINMDRLMEAEASLKQAVTIRNQSLHPVSPDSVATYERYALALRLNGRAADADRIEARAKTMRAELRYLVRR